MYAQLWDNVVTGESDVAIEGPPGVQVRDLSFATDGSWLLVENSDPGDYGFVINQSIDAIGGPYSPLVALAADVTLP